jgi:PKD repeat protein
MQKFTFFLLGFCLFFSLPITAQISLNQSDIPTAGSAVIMAEASTTGVSPGSAGSNQTWDFSALDTIQIDTTTYITPAEAPNSDDFPMTNLVSYNQGGYFYNYVTSSALWGLGGAIDFAEPGNFVSIYFDPMSKQMVFPTTYGTTFSDSTNIDIIIEDPEGAFRTKTVQKSEFEVDGYGTVITPSGSFDALRMVVKRESIDSTWFELFGEWMLISSATSNDTTYNFLAEESHGTLVSMEILDDGSLVYVSHWLGNITEPQAPIADFGITDQGGGSIQFTDFSLNDPTSWLWDFGDGNTSSQQNPSHTYATGGEYQVCLTVTNSIGSNTLCETIIPTFPPTAAFTFTSLGGSSFGFEDQSTNNPTSWLWDFGDGSTSTEQDPDYTYEGPGTFTVCLTVSNSEGSDMTCQEVTVTAAPTAAFSYEIQGGGVVNFTDQSSNDPTSWLWNFGDGNTSTEQNPTHTFLPDANYTVCLSVTNAAGADVVCQTVAFTAAPVAAFTYTDNGGGNISFQDMSTNSPTSWMWDFADGNTSMEQNPDHTYTEAGTYNVCLIVTNDLGTDFTCEVIEITYAPVAAFSYQNFGGGFVEFQDQSVNNPSSWLWDFGDGNTSTEQDPTNQYPEPGTYNVCLTVVNDAGTDMICQDVTVAFAPVAAFTFTDDGSGTVTFQDLSVFGPTSWLWDFGDGNTTTEQNPSHTYAASGNYNVCLMVTNDQGLILSVCRLK